MNWQHLTYFKAVAERSNFAKAAEQLYVTPSTLSKAIHNLEDELGFPLFERRGRNIYLNAFGETFYKQVVKANSAIDEGIQQIYQELGLYTGTIRLTGLYVMCTKYLPILIKKFKAKYPDTVFSLEYKITRQILEQVLNGECDLGFCSDYAGETAEYVEIDRTWLYTEEMVMIAAKDHWMAQEEYVDVKKLKNESFILHKNVNSGISYVFWPFFQKNGITPKVSYMVSDNHSLIGLVASGLGIAMVPKELSAEHEGVITRKFLKDPPLRDHYMIWKKDGFISPAVQAFKQLTLDFMRKEGAQSEVQDTHLEG